MIREAADWLFAPPDTPVTAWRALWWWEKRRLLFNLIVGAYGAICLAIFLFALTTSHHLQPGEDAVEPLAILAAPFGINAAYTLGWLVEVPLRLLGLARSPRLGPVFMKLGLGFGLFLITLPAAGWSCVRLLQIVGGAQ